MKFCSKCNLPESDVTLQFCSRCGRLLASSNAHIPSGQISLGQGVTPGSAFAQTPSPHSALTPGTPHAIPSNPVALNPAYTPSNAGLAVSQTPVAMPASLASPSQAGLQAGGNTPAQPVATFSHSGAALRSSRAISKSVRKKLEMAVSAGSLKDVHFNLALALAELDYYGLSNFSNTSRHQRGSSGTNAFGQGVSNNWVEGLPNGQLLRDVIADIEHLWVVRPQLTPVEERTKRSEFQDRVRSESQVRYSRELQYATWQLGAITVGSWLLLSPLHVLTWFLAAGSQKSTMESPPD